MTRDSGRTKSRDEPGALRSGFARAPGPGAAGRAAAETPTLPKTRHEVGFTLLEVLVATALMGIAVAAMMSGISGSLRNLARAEAHEKAVLVGRAQLNRLLVEEELRPGRLDGRWDDDYRWVAEVRQWDPAGEPSEVFSPRLAPLMMVRLTVFWKGVAGEKSATFETCKFEQPR